MVPNERRLFSVMVILVAEFCNLRTEVTVAPPLGGLITGAVHYIVNFGKICLSGKAVLYAEKEGYHHGDKH